MPVDHTVASRSATFATMLLALVQMLHLAGGGHAAYVNVILLTLVIATSAACIRMRRVNSLESRLTVGMLAMVSGGGILLTLTAGLPSQGARPPTLFTGSILFLSLVVLGLLVTDRTGRPPRRSPRARRAVQQRSTSPYAS